MHSANCLGFELQRSDCGCRRWVGEDACRSLLPSSCGGGLRRGKLLLALAAASACSIGTASVSENRVPVGTHGTVVQAIVDGQKYDGQRRSFLEGQMRGLACQ